LIRRALGGFFCFLVAAGARAAFEERPPSARAAALGEAMTAAGGGAEDWLYNPAALRGLSRAEAVSGYTRLLGEEGLPAGAVVLGVPTEKHGGWGVSFSQMGSAFYREREFSAGVAAFLSTGLAAGAAVTGSFLDMDRYGGASAWGLDAGVIARPHPRASLGFACKRLNHPRFPGARDGLPPSFRMGASFLPGRGARLSIDAVKPQDRSFSTRIGAELPMGKGFFLRAGGQTRPARYALGFGAAAPLFRLDYVFLTHPFLGDQHQVSMAFSWGPARS
jgi:hypothetical protein